MKGFLSFLILMLISPASYAASGGRVISLKPSLTIQMEKNTALQLKVFKNEKAQANRIQLETNKRDKLSLKRNTIAPSRITSVVTSPIIPVLAIRTPMIQPTVPSSNITENTIKNVDIDRVRTEWFNWYNTTRTGLGLTPYNYDPRLSITAHDWNIVFTSGKGLNHHRRNPGDNYYDFPVIDDWFQARGIDPIVIDRSKHTENVGYGYYSCNAPDCTDELIQSIHSTYDFFMSEKGKSYDAHYRSIVNPYFTKMGLDIITVPSEKRYYITIHYITK